MIEKNISILMLAHRTPPIHGASIVGDLVYGVLKHQGYNLSYVELSSSKSIGETGKLNYRKLIFMIRKIVDLIFKILTKKPVIIYFTPSISGISVYKDFIFMAILKLYKVFNNQVRILIHLHMRPGKSSFIFNKIIRFYFINNEIIFLSKMLVQDFSKRQLNKSIIHVLWNTIEPITDKITAIQNAKKFRIIKDIKEKNILYVGHMKESKGYKRGLEIARTVLSNLEGFTFHFMGEFNSKKDYKFFHNFIQKNKLNKKVLYVGANYDSAAKQEVFLKSDLLIVPSFSEAFPLVVLEAFSVGLPVVSTDTGAVPELIAYDFGSTINQKINEDTFIKEFASAIIETFNTWNFESSKKSIERFHLKYCHEVFQHNLIKIIKTND